MIYFKILVYNFHTPGLAGDTLERFKMDKTMEGARNDAVRYAREVAARYSVADNVSVMVYEKGGAFFVRPDKMADGFGAVPEGAGVYCIAQRWNPREIQIRYAGARSEFSDG